MQPFKFPRQCPITEVRTVHVACEQAHQGAARAVGEVEQAESGLC